MSQFELAKVIQALIWTQKPRSHLQLQSQHSSEASTDGLTILELVLKLVFVFKSMLVTTEACVGLVPTEPSELVTAAALDPLR